MFTPYLFEEAYSRLPVYNYKVPDVHMSVYSSHVVHAKATAPTFGGNNDCTHLHHAVIFLTLLSMLPVFTPLTHNAQHSSGTMQPYSIMGDLNLHQVGSSSLMYCGHVEVTMMLLIGARVNVMLITLYIVVDCSTHWCGVLNEGYIGYTYVHVCKIRMYVVPCLRNVKWSH